MKSASSSEVEILRSIPHVRYWCSGKHPFILSDGPKQVHYDHAEKALKYIQNVIETGTQLLICDEILDTIIFNILQPKRIIDLMHQCRSHKIELVMTGRTAPSEIMDQADYITQFVQVKHPYYKGIKARRGIEF